MHVSLFQGDKALEQSIAMIVFDCLEASSTDHYPYKKSEIAPGTYKGYCSHGNSSLHVSTVYEGECMQIRCQESDIGNEQIHVTIKMVWSQFSFKVNSINFKKLCESHSF